MNKKPSSQVVLNLIQRAIKIGAFDWTSQKSIVIYPLPSKHGIKYITVDFKVTES